MLYFLMEKELITKSEFARRAGVSASAVSQAALKDPLKKAVEKKRINAAHPAAVAYLENKVPDVEITVNGKSVSTSKPSGHTARNQSKKAGATNEGDFQIPGNILEFAEWTIRDVVTTFGTDYRFVDYLKAIKEIEMIDEKRVKTAKAKGELVSRELIRTGVIDHVDSMLTKMLTDGATTIARRATAMHDAGRDLEEVEKFVAEQLGSFIRPMKTRVSRTLKNVGD
jgi:hypothetical protein